MTPHLIIVAVAVVICANGCALNIIRCPPHSVIHQTVDRVVENVHTTRVGPDNGARTMMGNVRRCVFVCGEHYTNRIAQHTS